MVHLPRSYLYDLAAALAETPGVTAVFDALSYSARKEYVRQVESAKAHDTRKRRIAGIVTKLAGQLVKEE